MLSLKTIRFLPVSGIFLFWSMVFCHPSIIDALPDRGFSDEDWEGPRRKREYQNLQEERFQMECEYLGLKNKQKKKARPLYDEAQKKKDKIKFELNTCLLKHQNACNRLKKIEKDYFEKLSALLNEKQKKKLKKLLE